MRVSVVRLRFNGHKLTKDRLKEIPPLCGDLGFERELDRRRELWVPTAFLLDDRLDTVIPRLCKARLAQVRGPAFLLVGLEELFMRKQVTYLPQAWWCRLVEPEPTASPPTE